MSLIICAFGLEKALQDKIQVALIFAMRLMVIFIALILVREIKANEILGESGPPGKQRIRLMFSDTSGAFDTNLHSEKLKRASAFLPVYQPEYTSWALSSSWHKLTLDGNNLPIRGNFVLPEKLESFQYGAAWAYKGVVRNEYGLQASYGSASDLPFAGNDVTTVSATATLKVPEASDDSAWIYFLNYSNNRAFLSNVPIPGFAYLFSDISKKQGGAIGLPFLSFWQRPTTDLSYSVFVVIPSTVRLQTAYSLLPILQLFSRYEYSQLTFMRKDRSNKSERIIYDSMKAILGAKAFLGPGTFCEFSLIRSFRRSIFDGENVFDKSGSTLDLEDEWLGSISLQISI